MDAHGSALRAGMQIRTYVLEAPVGTFQGQVQWLVECRGCGRKRVVLSKRLAEMRFDRRLTGCKRCNGRERRRMNGASSTPEYHAWYNAYRRCHVENDPSFPWYGARGIAMHPDWHPPSAEGFRLFLEHIGPRPNSEMSLDRIDNDKGYEPGNIRWAPRCVQRENQRPRSDAPSSRSVFRAIRRVTQAVGYWTRHLVYALQSEPGVTDLRKAAVIDRLEHPPEWWHLARKPPFVSVRKAHHEFVEFARHGHDGLMVRSVTRSPRLPGGHVIGGRRPSVVFRKDFYASADEATEALLARLESRR